MFGGRNISASNTFLSRIMHIITANYTVNMAPQSPNKCVCLRLRHFYCTFDFLSNSIPILNMKSTCSQMLSPGTHQGCALLIPFNISSHNSSVNYLIFVDTTIIELISDNDKSSYHQKVVGTITT